MSVLAARACNSWQFNQTRSTWMIVYLCNFNFSFFKHISIYIHTHIIIYHCSPFEKWVTSDLRNDFANASLSRKRDAVKDFGFVCFLHFINNKSPFKVYFFKGFTSSLANFRCPENLFIIYSFQILWNNMWQVYPQFLSTYLIRGSFRKLSYFQRIRNPSKWRRIWESYGKLKWKPLQSKVNSN